VIGGFPNVDPNCKGCGKPMVIENAWMTDGCPCNHPLGINNQNETRWRLLMRLQQLQSIERDAARAEVARLRKEMNGLVSGLRSHLADVACRIGPARRPLDIKHELEQLHSSYNSWTDQSAESEVARLTTELAARGGPDEVDIDRIPWSKLSPPKLTWLRVNSQVCLKCGITCGESKQKYCGDNCDKDNHHVWAMPSETKAISARLRRLGLTPDSGDPATTTEGG
jgi:hypothetical protein